MPKSRLGPRKSGTGTEIWLKKIMSPEGGDQEELEKVKQAAEQALKYFEKMGR